MDNQSAIITHEIVGFLLLIVAMTERALSTFDSPGQTIGLPRRKQRRDGLSRVRNFGLWSGFK